MKFKDLEPGDKFSFTDNEDKVWVKESNRRYTSEYLIRPFQDLKIISTNLLVIFKGKEEIEDHKSKPKRVKRSNAALTAIMGTLMVLKH